MTKNVILKAELNQIRRMIDQNYTTDKILQELHIQPRTLQRRLNLIYKEDKLTWGELAKESLESRALKIMGSLQLCIDVKEIATDEKQDPKARTEASIKVVDANIMVYNILENGPKPKQQALGV